MDELLPAVLRMRDQRFADVITLVIGLAAETHPEELRTALGKVFDFSGVEEIAKRSMLVVSAAQKGAEEVRSEIAEVRKELDGIRQDVEAIHERISKAARLHSAAHSAASKGNGGTPGMPGG